MEANSNMSQLVIETINTIFEKLFTSIDTKLYEVLDDLTFINSEILEDKYFGKIFDSSEYSVEYGFAFNLKIKM